MHLNIIRKFFLTTAFALFSLLSFSQQATLVINEDPMLSEMLKIQKEMEKENKLSFGYTIQLYYGELDKANKVIKNYKSDFSDWPASLEYETPNYKVWAGNFSSRIEAERALLQIQKKFSSAFILKPGKK